MERLTPERLSELRRIAEAATPGPRGLDCFEAFHPRTVLSLLDQIEALRRDVAAVANGMRSTVEMYRDSFDPYDHDAVDELEHYEKLLRETLEKHQPEVSGDGLT